MSREPPVAGFVSFYLAKKTFGMHGGIKKAPERARGQKPGRRRIVRRIRRRNILRTDDNVVCRIKDREDMIAETVFRDGHLRSELQRVGARLIFCFGIERGEKC